MIEFPEDARPNRRRARILAAVVVPLVVVIAAGAVVLVHAHRPPAAPPTVPVATAVVTRTDLSISQNLPGTLGFGTATPLTGHGSGVITELPAAGATIARGQSLYEVNEQPVILFYGDTPLFRPLSLPAKATTTPTEGEDITVVADNLRELGYRVGEQPEAAATGGDVYTASLATAVKHWQLAMHLPVTGTVDPATVVVLPGAVRVDGLQARLGDPAAEPLMTLTTTAKVITVQVAVTDQAGIVAGAAVTIALPDGTQIPGTVRAISPTVQAPDDQQADSGAQPTVDVTVAPKNSADVARWTAAPVTVTFTTGVRRGVLAVPVTALLAVQGGGYALQRTDGSLVAVTTGMFASGMVEVSGTGVHAGLRVRAAQS